MGQTISVVMIGVCRVQGESEVRAIQKWQTALCTPHIRCRAIPPELIIAASAACRDRGGPGQGWPLAEQSSVVGGEVAEVVKTITAGHLGDGL